MPIRPVFTALAKELPDLPRWVLTRWMLLSGRCEVFGSENAPAGYVARSLDVPLVGVVGLPGSSVIQRAVEGASEETELIAAVESFDHVATMLPDWEAEPATLYQLPEGARSVEVVGVRLLDQDDLTGLDHVPEDLRQELIGLSRWSPIAAAYADGIAASFCCAFAETETLWDVSIDTLSAYRRRGLACQCARYLIEHFRRLGKKAVWGAAQSNPASARLAEKLGFVAVDQLMVFSPARGE